MRTRLSVEDRLLILGCKEDLDPEEQEELRGIIPRVMDWNRVVDSASRNRVLVRLAHHLSRHPLPGPVKARLIDLYLRAQGRVHVVKEGFEKALPVILKRHPRVILLRGILYCYTIYAQDLKRNMGDIDLLLDKRPTFSVAGYLRDHYSPQDEVLRALPEGLDLEYHYDLGVYTSWGMRTAKIDMKELWGRSRPLSIGQHEVGMLSPEDNLIYLCHHNLTKGFVGLYRFVDMYRILQTYSIDWEELLRRAQRYRVVRAIWLNGCVLEQIYGDVLPAGLLRRIQPPPPFRQIILHLLDFRSILHDPHPDLRYPHSSSFRNAKRVLMIMLTLVRPGNLHKILWAPFNKALHALHYRMMTNTALKPFWENTMKRLRRGRTERAFTFR